MNLIKLTSSDGCTRGSTHWYPSRKLTLFIKETPRLCTSDVIHAYRSLNLALLVNPIHANIYEPRIFEAVGEICVEDGLKVGCFELTTTEEVGQPEWYINVNTRRKVQLQFAILCAKEVLPIFEDRYPNDIRPRKAIEAANKTLKENDVVYAALAAADAADAARVAYTARAADAAVYAGYAALSAAETAETAETADAALAAADAARAAEAAARAAYTARAAEAAARAAYTAAYTIDFNKLADEAVRLQG